MNVGLVDGDGDLKYYASWNSFRTGITGVVDEETSMTFAKDDFYLYRTDNWALLGLWSDTQWIRDSHTSLTELFTIEETNALKSEVDLLQFDRFTRQAGCTSNDPNPIEAQQIVWLHSFTTSPWRNIMGYGLPTLSQGAELQKVDFKLIYDFDYEATAGTYVINTGIKFQDVI